MGKVKEYFADRELSSDEYMSEEEIKEGMNTIGILVIGMWIGVFIGILIVGLFNKENRDDV